MEVPALAGSTPTRCSRKGRPVPNSTEVITIAKSEVDMATELARLPFVTYTRTKPPTADAGRCFEFDSSSQHGCQGKAKFHGDFSEFRTEF